MCKDGTGADGNTKGKCNENNKSSLKAALGDDGAQHWPKISAASSGTGNANEVDSTDQISGEMTGLKTEEKGTVAGLFARTVEGAEVVEIIVFDFTSKSCGLKTCGKDALDPYHMQF